MIGLNRKTALLALGALLALPLAQPRKSAAQELPWRELQPGLCLATFRDSPGALTAEEEGGDIVVLRISPERFSLRLLLASENGGQGRTMQQWVRQNGLVAAINAGMYWEDERTSAGYLKNFDHVNNQTIHPEFGAFLVFNPKPGVSPQVRIVDKVNNPDWRGQIERYHSVVQNYRMIGSDRSNAWEQSSQSHSIASVGMDASGNVLFIFCQPQKSIHNFNEILLDLPIDLQSCMFVEGGPVAGLYVDAGKTEQGWHGVSESTFWSERPGSMVEVPNVIGVVEEGTAEQEIDK
jgi:uncharacterized protein YigE (DUF2233 family)